MLRRTLVVSLAALSVALAPTVLATASGFSRAAASTSSASSHVHFASVPVRACRSSYASTGTSTPPRMPRSRVIAIPGNLEGRVAVYTDTRQWLRVLAPNGWSCVACVENGPFELSIVPRGEKVPGFCTDPGGMQRKDGRIGLNVTGYGASLSMYQLVCPYFRSARVDLYKSVAGLKPSICRRPHRELVSSVAMGLKEVDDPPHVAGDNFPSGGIHWALGNASWGIEQGSYLLTCTLPSSLHALCYASLAWFAGQWKRPST